ncbi:hypothetical protein KDW49_02725 [Burkholderia dolosa]|jgi:hypothetical protein|uniref:hypothetical protein n=1 Tax=Burkholderia dolosa TaxID=152500 RepID=UPI001B9A2BCA|nr:hypothetical protein [Burkholderia dolosa]MBR8299643.1 hypothetical protein [Burkholderia dolosa]
MNPQSTFIDVPSLAGLAGELHIAPRCAVVPRIGCIGRIGRFDPKRTAVAAAAALVLGIVATGRFVAREVVPLHGGNAAERR